MHLSDEVNELTQVERDRVIEWLRVNRPSQLRIALRELGYLTSPTRPQGLPMAIPGPHWIRSHQAKCPDAPEGCGEYTSQYDGKGPAVIWHKPDCPVKAEEEAKKQERCTASSWRGKSKQPYGPGDFNRCTEIGFHDEHIDDFGNVFVLEPSFRVIKHTKPRSNNG